MRTSNAVFLALSIVLGCSRPSNGPGGAGSASAALASASTVAPAPSHSGVAKPHGSASPAVVLSTLVAAEDGKDPLLTPEAAGIPKVDFGPPGPLTIKGYPAAEPLQIGMVDYATRVGYSKDGKQVIACGEMSPSGNQCFVNDGKATNLVQTDRDGGDKRTVGPDLAAAMKALQEGQSRTLPVDKAKNTLVAPPLSAERGGATWPYASDIALEVTTVAAEAGSAILKLGGRYAKEDPVFSVSLSVKPVGDGSLTYAGAWNAILTSPANDELALVGHFYCMEWCNEIVISRIGYGAIASLVYNDTGFRHHQKKDYPGSRDLWLKAVWANPRAPLPPYNLACAYALLKDAKNAEKALKLAIAVGGVSVRKRAENDPDFKGFYDAPWFMKVTD